MSEAPETHETAAAPAEAAAEVTPFTAYSLLGFGALCLALVGYFTGMAQVKAPKVRGFHGDLPAHAVPLDPAKPPPGIEPAVSYTEMRSVKRGPNARFESHLKDLKEQAPAVTEAVSVTEIQRLEAAEDRALRRAYSGAPPEIPHAIDQQSVTSCLACHGEGKVIDGVVASPVSHSKELGNCTQCHAPPPVSFLAQVAEERAPANAFRGAPSPIHGERAYPGAPPVIPHATRMREDCTTCHGVKARPGLRTTHPWRVNCRQCHASGTGFAR